MLFRSCTATTEIYTLSLHDALPDLHWLAGEELSFADIAAAAHISCVDYLGDVPWDDHAPAKTWYSRIKSRPSFRPLLGERMEVIVPPQHYDKVDF